MNLINLINLNNMKNWPILIISAGIMTLSACTQVKTDTFKIAGIPEELTWYNSPEKWEYDQNNLNITAGKLTDLFIDPDGTFKAVNSPFTVFQPVDSFLLSCKVRVNFKSDYDAGVLIIYGQENQWVKLCFEFSPQHKPMVVSVVTNGISDDCNHVSIDTNVVYLRVAGLGENIFSFHYSVDGNYWNMVRYFTLKDAKKVDVGFSSQSPTGEGCTAVFSEINYKEKYLADIRSGE